MGKRGLGARYWTLTAAATVSAAGDGLTLVAAMTILYQHSHSPLALGGAYFMRFASAVLVGFLAGAVGDRLRRRPLMAGLDALRMPLMISFPLLAAINPYLLYLGLFLHGSAEAVVAPARQASVPSVVAEDQVARGNALLVAGMSLANAAGFAASALLFAVKVPLSIFFLIDGLSFGLCALLVLLIGDLGGGVKTMSVSAGARRAWAIRSARPYLFASTSGTLFLMMSGPSLLPLAASFSADHASSLYGSYQAIQMAGGLIGSLIVAKLARSRMQMVVGCGLIFGVAAAAMGLGPLAVSLAAMLASGVANAAWSISYQTIMVQTAAPESRASLMSLNFTLRQIAAPIGLLVGSLIATYSGARSTFLVLGAGFFLSTLFFWAIAGRQKSGAAASN